jgi:hypothetical protein
MIFLAQTIVPLDWLSKSEPRFDIPHRAVAKAVKRRRRRNAGSFNL